jgi:hypothetical protein
MVEFFSERKLINVAFAKKLLGLKALLLLD